MKRVRTAAWIGAGLLACGLACGAAGDRAAPVRLDRPVARPLERGPEAAQVIVISFDGLAPWVAADTETPTLDRLVREGRTARRAETVLPSRTLPSHLSMLAGVPPDVHGLLWNTWQPDRRVDVPTVYDVCAERGWRCGMVASKSKFAHLVENEPGVEYYRLVDEAEAGFAAALAYLRERDPEFLLLHVKELDSIGHDDGWGSDAQREGLRRVDAQLADFVGALGMLPPRRRVLILTSDHGGTGHHHGGDSPKEMEIPWIAWGVGIERGAIDGTVSTMDTAATVLALLGAAPPPEWHWQGRARLP